MQLAAVPHQTWTTTRQCRWAQARHQGKPTRPRRPHDLLRDSPARCEVPSPTRACCHQRAHTSAHTITQPHTQPHTHTHTHTPSHTHTARGTLHDMAWHAWEQDRATTALRTGRGGFGTRGLAAAASAGRTATAGGMAGQAAPAPEGACEGLRTHTHTHTQSRDTPVDSNGIVLAPRRWT